LLCCLADEAFPECINEADNVAWHGLPDPVTILGALGYYLGLPHTRGESHMSKGMDRKKEDKKKPAKSLLEKRLAKAEKKAARR
jgi:hypothetical protein